MALLPSPWQVAAAVDCFLCSVACSFFKRSSRGTVNRVLDRVPLIDDEHVRMQITMSPACGSCPARAAVVCMHARRLATTGRHWHYLDPAERASVEERLERTRLGTNILDTPGTDRTISLALSDHSVFHPLSPSPSLHFTHADHANSMMRLRRAFQESAGLLLQSSGSLQLPEQSCALEDPALEVCIGHKG